ncbi:MAG: hypothetical protein GQ560_01985, partial [Dehalococcoidia bacterium]|nr:hypothetical protein [Dehalococcoidia bacterium]
YDSGSFYRYSDSAANNHGMGGDCGDILWFNCMITGLLAGEGKAHDMPLRVNVINIGSI